MLEIKHRVKFDHYLNSRINPLPDELYSKACIDAT